MTKNSGVAGKTVEQLRRSNAAKDRQEKRGHRSADEQLRLLASRPGRSSRERQRLVGVVVGEQK